MNPRINIEELKKLDERTLTPLEARLVMFLKNEREACYWLDGKYEEALGEQVELENMVKRLKEAGGYPVHA